MPVGWKYLVLGMALALVFTISPALRFMGWFVGSLFHETGHVIFAWFVGCPAWPAISLRGHAAAFHQAQSGFVLAMVGLALLLGTVLAWRHDRWKLPMVALLVAWPLLAFVRGPREVGFLLSGHLAEMMFAGIFLWRARTGKAIEHEAERPLYACLGWFLLARNLVLTLGLTFTASARDWYLQSGSFGLTNDYLRVATEWLHLPLEAVGAFMTLGALAVFPVVLALTWTPPAPPAPRWRPPSIPHPTATTGPRAAPALANGLPALANRAPSRAVMPRVIPRSR
ncbi:MAG: hypothetical protein ACC662_11450 [Planctomycetota bacterium]